MSEKIIDKPWAIVYGPKCKLGTGLMYGLGLTREDAWHNAILVYSGVDEGPVQMKRDKLMLQKRGMVARRVIISLEK